MESGTTQTPTPHTPRTCLQLMYVLLSRGEIEITCDQSQFKNQYEEHWKDMETLLPGLLPR